MVDKNINHSLLKDDVPSICNCVYKAVDPNSACGNQSNCVNRLTFVECDPETCPTGTNCLNREISTARKPKLIIRKFKEKGFGIVAGENIVVNQFISQYFGEVFE
ncbi:Histone-lysine N-methyltransferase, H3 lysine-36 and H4 lysine-20 specific [Bonamia ostreae]|uniref:Histone-lysine N-methyltransferase, H3 lysine-36 and H4 lysine-20 specific n=1 Tax=Bonamia ostreae TaxID=126728 RepID=A0ABV2AUW2_9EUKA